MSKVVIFTDGACSPNPGVGGMGALLILNKTEHRKCFWGGEVKATNQRMEMQAALFALRALKKPAKVDLRTDSQYLIRGITTWIGGWKRSGWVTKEGKPVLNQDLWKGLDEMVGIHDITWQWVKGHGASRGNAHADFLAVNGRRKTERQRLALWWEEWSEAMMEEKGGERAG